MIVAGRVFFNFSRMMADTRTIVCYDVDILRTNHNKSVQTAIIKSKEHEHG